MKKNTRRTWKKFQMRRATYVKVQENETTNMLLGNVMLVMEKEKGVLGKLTIHSKKPM